MRKPINILNCSAHVPVSHTGWNMLCISRRLIGNADVLCAGWTTSLRHVINTSLILPATRKPRCVAVAQPRGFVDTFHMSNVHESVVTYFRPIIEGHAKKARLVAGARWLADSCHVTDRGRRPLAPLASWGKPTNFLHTPSLTFCSVGVVFWPKLEGFSRYEAVMARRYLVLGILGILLLTGKL